MLKNPNRESRRAGAGPGAGGISWDESNLEANEVIKAGLSSVRINEPKTPYHGPLDPLDPDHMDHDEGLQPLTLDDSHSMNGGRWGSQPAGPPSFMRRAYANGHDSELGSQHGHMEGGDGEPPPRTR
ncbi:MAG: hypothetical protein WDW38_010344 [Sanguina aurantia]